MGGVAGPLVRGAKAVVTSGTIGQGAGRQGDGRRRKFFVLAKPRLTGMLKSNSFFDGLRVYKRSHYVPGLLTQASHSDCAIKMDEYAQTSQFCRKWQLMS